MARFDSASRLAQRLIKKNGRPIVIRRVGDAPSANPDKPWRTGDPDVSFDTATAVFLDFDDLDDSGERIEDVSVQVGDKIALIAGLDLDAAPNLRDQVQYDDDGDGQPNEDEDSWSIINVKTLEPNGQQVLYRLHLRR